MNKLALLPFAILAAALPVSAQTPPEPGVLPGVTIVNISRNAPNQASVFPQVAVSRSNPNLVAVAWRRYGLPIDTNALKENRLAECHVAISHDGGKNFSDTNMTPYLRTMKQGTEPELWGCNAPWVTIARDGTIYFGGALFTAGGVVQTDPKQGRAGVSVSTDGGASWSKMAYGINIAHFAPGVTGLNGGMKLEDTPWDGANGIADPVTGTFYSTSGGVTAVSDDKARSFGMVYGTGGGTLSAAFGIAATAHVVTDATTFPGAKCPCLAFGASSDKAQSWKQMLVADSSQFNRTGTTRYPVVAADPVHKGHFAIAAYAPDHHSVKVYYTDDTGQSWKMASPNAVPANVPVTDVNMASAGYTSDGRLLVTWRGFRNPGAFNTFVAMMTGDAFGPTVKASPELSIYPPLTYAGNYGNGNGGGDFTTWVTGNDSHAFVAFPYAPGGQVEDTVLAGVPLSLLAR
jgi:hypothetical protein